MSKVAYVLGNGNCNHVVRCAAQSNMTTMVEVLMTLASSGAAYGIDIYLKIYLDIKILFFFL